VILVSSWQHAIFKDSTAVGFDSMYSTRVYSHRTIKLLTTVIAKSLPTVSRQNI
jgi:hypothetical protein